MGPVTVASWPVIIRLSSLVELLDVQSLNGDEEKQ
jgi:hypothetical protein